MRALSIIALFISLTGMQVFGQHPLIGTWEMISVKGIDADGEPFFLDTTSVRETKIITPTHYMLIAWDVGEDSLYFNRTMAGEVRLEGEKYIEVPKQASVQIFENLDVNFSWKLEGDVFTQSGTIVRPDGKRVVLEALKFRRVKDVKPQPNNPSIGSWSQVAAHYTAADGKDNPTFSDTDKRFLVVTPTHWMRMDHKNKKFAGVLYGTYMMTGGEHLSTKVNFSSYPGQTGALHKFSQKLKGNRIHFTAAGKTPDGKPATYHDEFEKQ